MNILFLAPAVNKTNIPSDYKHIVDACKSYTHSIIDGYLKKDTESPQDRYKRLVSDMRKAEAMIVEGTTLTVETSRLITLALQLHLPVLLVYTKNNPETSVFETSRLLSLKKYDSKTLGKVLEKFFRQVDKQRLLYRFNLMLSKDLGAYVLDRSRKHKVSKADYIRSLILRDMEKSS
jgi:hypothetical protein